MVKDVARLCPHTQGPRQTGRSQDPPPTKVWGPPSLIIQGAMHCAAALTPAKTLLLDHRQAPVAQQLLGRP